MLSFSTIKYRFSVLFFVLCVFLYGCSPEQITVLTTENDADVLREYIIPYSAFEGTNPYNSNSAVMSELSLLLYDSLVVSNSENEFELSLAQDIFTEDFKTYVITLREDNTFSDGTLITAADVYASFLTAKGSTTYSYSLASVRDISYEENIITVTLDKALALFQNVLTFPILKESEQTRLNPTSSGDYYKDGEALYARDANALTDNIKLYEARTEEELINALNSGLITLLDTTFLDGFAPHPDLSVTTYKTNSLVFIGFSPLSDKFNTVEMRQRLSLALPTERMSYGTPSELFTVANSIFPPTYNFENTTYNIVDSAQNTVRIDLLYHTASTGRALLAELFVTSAKDFGFDINLIGVSDEQSFLAKVAEGNYDIVMAQTRLPEHMNLSSILYPEGAIYPITAMYERVTLSDNTEPQTQQELQANAPADELVSLYEEFQSTGDASIFNETFNEYLPIIPMAFANGTIHHLTEDVIIDN